MCFHNMSNTHQFMQYDDSLCHYLALSSDLDRLKIGVSLFKCPTKSVLTLVNKLLRIKKVYITFLL